MNGCNKNVNAASNNDPATNSSRRVITFNYETVHDPFASSIIIDGVELNNNSTMKDLLLYSDGGDDSIDKEHDLELNSKYGKQLYFKVEVENGREFLFKKNRFLNSTVDFIYSLESVVSPLSIIIIPK